MFRYGPGFHHGPGVLGWFFFALLVVAVVLGVIALVRLWSHPGRRFTPLHVGPPPGPIDPALSELRVRYARGDITWDDFAQRASNLGYPVPPAPPPGASPPEPGSAPTST